MENYLANTGASIVALIALGITLTGISIVLIVSRRTNNRRGIVALALAGSLALTSFSPNFAHAAACAPVTPSQAAMASQPITSSGNATEPQTINVLGFVMPSPGATVVLSSLKLELPTNLVAGSTVSPDGKTVTVPGEGTYVAAGDGTITFTPAADFSVMAIGITYIVLDSAGHTTKNTYTPAIAQVLLELPDTGLSGIQHAWVGPGETDYVIGDIYGNGGNPNVATCAGLAASIIDKNTDSPVTANLTQYIDIDPSTPGIQRVVDRSADLGWRLEYTPANDTLTLTVTSESLYTLSIIEPSDSSVPLILTSFSDLKYTIAPNPYLGVPTNDGVIYATHAANDAP